LVELSFLDFFIIDVVFLSDESEIFLVKKIEFEKNKINNKNIIFVLGLIFSFDLEFNAPPLKLFVIEFIKFELDFENIILNIIPRASSICIIIKNVII